MKISLVDHPCGALDPDVDPIHVVYAPLIGPTALIAMQWLYTIARFHPHDSPAEISSRELARLSGTSSGRINRALKRLNDHGLLELTSPDAPTAEETTMDDRNASIGAITIRLPRTLPWPPQHRITNLPPLSQRCIQCLMATKQAATAIAS